MGSYDLSHLWIGSDIFMIAYYTCNVSDTVFYTSEDGHMVG